MKTCKKCSNDRPFSAYSMDRRRKDGLSIYCKLCLAKKYEERKSTLSTRQRKEIWDGANIRRHGITVEYYNELLEKQNGVCAICQGDSGSRRFNIDHDHACCSGLYSCGKCVRGLLCGSCNKAIGLLKENKEIVLRVLNYLQL